MIVLTILKFIRAVWVEARARQREAQKRHTNQRHD